MTRTHGGAPEGKGWLAKAPYGHWRTMTFLAALRCDRVDAPASSTPHQWPAAFAYVEADSAPHLQPGDVVIIDNLASHKKAGGEKAIRATGARLLFLPPYRPISTHRTGGSLTQNAPAKAKHRSVETTWRQIGTSSTASAGRVRQLPHKCKIACILTPEGRFPSNSDPSDVYVSASFPLGLDRPGRADGDDGGGQDRRYPARLFRGAVPIKEIVRPLSVVARDGAKIIRGHETEFKL